MDDEKLDRALLELRRTLEAEPSRRASKPRECLTFSRARELALDPSRETLAEGTHRAGCRRCSRLVSGLVAQIPHPSIWTLMRLESGTLAASERAELQHHLESGGCRSCRRRFQTLRSITAPLELVLSATGLTAGKVRAAVPGPTVLISGRNAALEAELVRDGQQLTLEIRTREPALSETLVAYSLQDPEHQTLLHGFLVLAPDVEGWWAAEAFIHPDLFDSADTGSRLTLAVSSVHSGGLSTAEWQRVMECARQIGDHPPIRRAWAMYAARTLEELEDIPASVRESLQNIRDDGGSSSVAN